MSNTLLIPLNDGTQHTVYGHWVKLAESEGWEFVLVQPLPASLRLGFCTNDMPPLVEPGPNKTICGFFSSVIVEQL